MEGGGCGGEGGGENVEGAAAGGGELASANSFRIATDAAADSAPAPAGAMASARASSVDTSDTCTRAAAPPPGAHDASTAAQPPAVRPLAARLLSLSVSLSHSSRVLCSLSRSVRVAIYSGALASSRRGLSIVIVRGGGGGGVLAQVGVARLVADAELEDVQWDSPGQDGYHELCPRWELADGGTAMMDTTPPATTADRADPSGCGPRIAPARVAASCAR